MYLLILAFLVHGFVLYRDIVKTRVGRAFQALRDNELVAYGFGGTVSRYKLIAFIMSSVYAGLAGVLYAHQACYIHPNDPFHPWLGPPSADWA